MAFGVDIICTLLIPCIHITINNNENTYFFNTRKKKRKKVQLTLNIKGDNWCIGYPSMPHCVYVNSSMKKKCILCLYYFSNEKFIFLILNLNYLIMLNKQENCHLSFVDIYQHKNKNRKQKTEKKK